MKNILIDLNVIIYTLNQSDYYLESAKIIDLCERKKLKGFVCGHEITTLSYFLFKKSISRISNKKIISNILDIFSIINTNEKIFREALLSDMSDYEDAVIEVSVFQNNIDFIITYNLKDFFNSRVKAMTPGEFLLEEYNENGQR